MSPCLKSGVIFAERQSSEMTWESRTLEQSSYEGGYDVSCLFKYSSVYLIWSTSLMSVNIEQELYSMGKGSFTGAGYC